MNAHASEPAPTPPPPDTTNPEPPARIPEDPEKSHTPMPPPGRSEHPKQ